MPSFVNKLKKGTKINMKYIKAKHCVALALGISSAGLVATADAETTTRTGSLDVSVDTSELNDAISQAESEGVKVFRDATRVRQGNAEATERNRQEAINYYREKANEIRGITTQYKTNKATYEQTVKQNEEDARTANAEMDGYKTSLAALGRGVTFISQTYSAGAKSAAAERARTGVELGKKYRDAKNAVADFNAIQNSMVGFQTQADQGNIKLQYQAVTIATPADAERYKELIKTAQQQLNTYVAGLNSASGTVPEASRPTYTLYTVTVDPALVTEYNNPVEIPTFEPVPVEKVPVPQVNYAFYDIRQASDTDAVINNKDDERITIKQEGEKVYQAMKNQTIAIASSNDPLPAGRWDKYHALTLTVNLPSEGVEMDETLTNLNNPNWTVSVEKDKHRVVFRATDDYLVEINEKQKQREGTIGGIINDQFTYQVPSVYLKLLKDNTKYTFSSDIMINHEYKASSGTIHVQTNQADPKKHNKNNKGVVIDGKEVFFNSTNNYNLTWDFDQYKGVNIDREMQKKGLDLIDYYPSDALDFNPNKHHILIKDGETTIGVGQADGTFKDTNNNTIAGVTWSKVDSYKGIDRKGPAIKVSVSGYDHPYYKNYVEAGKSLTVTIPMETRVIDQTPGVQGGKYGGNSYTNVFYQSDFGNIYKSNEVTNTVTVVDPHKDAVLSVANLASLDIKSNPSAEIEHKTNFYYRASGSTLNLGVLGSAPESYSITDAFHHADEYTGKYLVESNGDIQFKPGTALYQKYRKTGGKLPKDSDITKFTTQTIVRDVSRRGMNTPTNTVTNADGHWTIVKVDFDNDFLDQIDSEKSTFQMDVFFETKRIKNINSVDNIFQEEINGVMFDSTETLTNTRVNDVDKLKDDVKKSDEKVDNLRDEISSALSVIRRQVSNNAETILKNKREQDKENQIVTETLAEHHEQIEANRIVLVSVRRLAENNRNNISRTNSNLERVESRLGQIESRLNHVEKFESKLEQTDSELTIYVPTVLTDADALDYASNHGIAPGSIKRIYLDKNNRYVVVYNTSKTAINGGPKALDRPVHVETVNDHLIRVTVYDKNNIKEAQDELVSKGYKVSDISKTMVDGRDYIFTFDNRDGHIQNPDDVKPTDSDKIETVSIQIPVKYSETWKLKALEVDSLKPYITEGKYINDQLYEVTFKLVDGLTKDDILRMTDPLTK